jgi:hypothetical protein
VFGDDAGDESFEETLRSIARELGRSVERAMDNVELDEFAGAIGIDPAVAREWAESAGSWLRAHADSVSEELTFRVGAPRPRAGGEDPLRGAHSGEDPLRGADPHPLDLPTDEQGVALAALDSGRWVVEPGTHALAAKGDGPGPSDALGIVRELCVRDWIAADGEITLVGRHALSRWLDASTPR